MKNPINTLGRWSVPTNMRPNLRVYLAKAGFKDVPYHLFGILLITTFGVYFLIASYIFQTGILWGLLLSILYFVVSNAAFYAITMGAAAFYFNMKIYNRTKEIEEQLPEMLVLVSANLKGGMPFDQALWKAIRPEFGLLSEEMATVSKKVMTGHSLKDALQEFAQKYDSPTMKRTMNLIMGELGSGGKISWLLDKVIENLRKTRDLKAEMSANTLTFVIFITAIVVVIAPILFALAFNLMNILLDISGQIIPQIQDAAESGAASNIPTVPDIEVNMWNFKAFSVSAIAVISVFASMIISIIQRGDILGGIKYMPFFVGLSVAFYLISVNTLAGFLNFG